MCITLKKLEKDGLVAVYNNIFLDWEREGIIEVVPEDQLENFSHYLSYRPVVKLSSSTIKVRPVFDAQISAHEKNFPSISQCLEKSPNLIELIPSILLRFCENKIGAIAVIKGGRGPNGLNYLEAHGQKKI